MIEEASARCPSCGSMYPAGATFCPQCGHVLSTSSAAAAPAETPMQAGTPAATPAPNQSPNVLLIQPHESEARESNWGPWVALILVLVLVAAGFAMWSAGYFGTTTAAPTTQPDTRVSIENSPQVSSGQNTPPAQAATPPPATPPAPPPANPPTVDISKEPAIDIISVKGQPLATNSIEWRYGYTLRVRNNSDADIKASFRIQYLDANGYAVDDTVLENALVPARTEQTFYGDDMIPAAQAATVRTLYATVR